MQKSQKWTIAGKHHSRIQSAVHLMDGRKSPWKNAPQNGKRTQTQKEKVNLHQRGVTLNKPTN